MSGIVTIERAKLHEFLFAIAEDLYRAMENDMEGELDPEVVEELDNAIAKTIEELEIKDYDYTK